MLLLINLLALCLEKSLDGGLDLYRHEKLLFLSRYDPFPNNETGFSPIIEKSL